ncbi:ubiquitin carboxyl-terminal hydrolase 36 isoform X2 [Wyeomyia smithii]|uniref:ubiquitin carboxyl-terminal hydrolase 36 isoform X2 n=1 Tax=Wyeomyia smithii TaxID=174621 RepID=UPI002467F11C|nr:ubiquitin carboxyl-terminal hydrolase 36 isoform X2 [Wyeomyia smithii]
MTIFRRRKRARKRPTLPPMSWVLALFTQAVRVYKHVRYRLLAAPGVIKYFLLMWWQRWLGWQAVQSTITGRIATDDMYTDDECSVQCDDGSSGGSAKDQLPTPKRVLYPRDCVQLGWKASGRKWQTGAGMINVGNTCYLNSTLQALFHVPAIANWLISDSSHRERCDDRNDGCIICAMAKTLMASQGNQGAIKPYLVYSKLRLVCKHLVPGRQEDAHEFLRYLMEAMEKSFLSRFDKSKELDQYSKETTPLNQILGGYLRSEVKCLSCQHTSTTFQHFEDLLLDIRKANSIEEALDVYFARERLEEMQYRCEACKKRVAATKQFSLERAPFVLCIQLKRFSMLGGKINKHVELRNRLDLTPYSSKSATSSGKLTYKLVSMVTHLGNTQHCGHYTAIGSTESGTYYVFDDSSVRSISMQNVTSTNAYIIFYELESVQNGIKTSASSTATLASFANATGSSPRKIGNGGSSTGGTFTTNSSPLRLIGSSGNSNHNPLFPSKLENRTGFIGPVLPQQTQPKPKKLANGLSNNHHNSMNEKEGEIMVSSTTARLSPVSSTTSSLSSPSPNKNPTPNSPSSSKLVKNPLNQNPVSVKNKFGMTITTSNSASDVSNGINGTNISFKSSSTSSSSTACPSSSSSALPSMPKLCNSPAATKSASTGEKSFEGTNSTANGTLKSVTYPATTSTGEKNSYVNGLSSSKAVSLVPYDADDDEDDDEGDDSYGGNNANRLAKRHTTQQNNDSEEDTERALLGPVGNKKLPESPEEEESSRSPKSPPVIKTKTGLWKVSDNNVPTSSSSSSSANSSKSASPSTSGNSSPANYSHANGSSGGPLASGYQSSNSGNGGRQSNGFNGYNGGYNRSNDVVDQLQKFSHRGYGAPVRSWNGQQTNMERELMNERREDRKRQVEDDRETEMDRGRVKKVKTHYYPRDQRDSQIQNPFQSYQNQQMNGGGGGGGNNRNKWNNHCNGFGGGSKYGNGGGSQQFQHRNYHNNYQNGRNYQSGGFRNGGRHGGRNGFYNKSNHHHQRDNGSGNGFYNR